MRTKVIPFFLSILLFANAINFLNGQISIVQEEFYYHESTGMTIEDYEHYNLMNKANIAPRKKDNCVLTKLVYGWHPYWQNGLQTNYDWNLLSHFVYFAYAIDPATGNPSTTQAFSTAQSVTDALNAGVKVHLCATLFSNHSTFLNNITAQRNFMHQIVTLVLNRGAHGVNIDFEGMNSSHNAAFANFMNELADTFHTRIPGSEVTIALNAVEWSDVFNINAMKNKVDYFVIMGYDYYWGGSTTAGPTDPLYNFVTSYNYTLTKSITHYLNKGCPPNKLILGLPYYGREYGTVSNTIPSDVNNPPNCVSRTYKFVRDNTTGHYSATNKLWDQASFTPAYIFYDGTEWRQCFIDDKYSMGKRMDLINQRGIAGMGIWALGNDDGYSDFWDAIRDHFTTCALTPCVDSLFDMGGPLRNYYDNEDYTYTISPSNAQSITLNFTQLDLEPNNDMLWLYDGSSTSSQLIGSFTGNSLPGTLIANSGAFTLKFHSNSSINKSGFKLYYQCDQSPIDNIPPITLISPISTWQTQDFSVIFQDSDAESGIQKAYYQVIEYDGIDWGANPHRGFLGDNFDSPSINSRWNIITGNWVQENGCLIQTDSSIHNTHISTYLDQELSNRYLYEFEAKVLGNNLTNKRVGFYFFSSDSASENRGNGYFIWFRLETGKLEFYKVTNDVFSKVHETNCPLNLNQWYNIKVIYDRIDGGIWVYVNNLLKGKWIDSQPYNNGSYISFRTGNCSAQFNQIKVYRSRYENATIHIGVGPDNSKELRYQSINTLSPAGKIKSIVQDNADNLSNTAMCDVYVDYTPPIPPSYVWDGIGQDYDTIFLLPISTQWDHAQDPNSGISHYEVCLGSQPGYNDIVDWINVGTNNFYSFNPTSLIYDNFYYITVKTFNNAGMSIQTFSDGFRYIVVDQISIFNQNNKPWIIYPNPANDHIYIKGDINIEKLSIYSLLGAKIDCPIIEKHNNKVAIQIDHLSSGIYIFQINSGNQIYFYTWEKQ
jgi:spore germination protein YaaH